MFAFICNNCGYGLSATSGVPSECPICKDIFNLRRVSHEEYHKCETNDVKIMES